MALSTEIAKKIPQGIVMPKELSLFLDYIELCKPRYFQTHVQFYPIDEKRLSKFFSDSETVNFFGLLGKIGDGSFLAIWKNKNVQHFVLLGCHDDYNIILSSTALDFIRLMSIGYGFFDEDTTEQPPEENLIEKPFQEWVEQTFSVKIPKCGKEIINYNDNSFNDWLDC